MGEDEVVPLTIRATRCEVDVDALRAGVSAAREGLQSAMQALGEAGERMWLTLAATEREEFRVDSGGVLYVDGRAVGAVSAIAYQMAPPPAEAPARAIRLRA